ncbi:hypothetical protein DRQ20_04905, partial [bacterium]
MRKKYLLLLFLLPVVGWGGYVGKGWWMYGSLLGGMAGIGGGRFSGSEVGVGLGAVKRFNPGIGLNITGISIIGPGWSGGDEAYDGWFLCPYLIFMVPLAADTLMFVKDTLRKVYIYYPLVFYAVVGGLGSMEVYEVNNQSGGFRSAIGIDWTLKGKGFTIGLEMGSMGGWRYSLGYEPYSSSYIGITLKLGGWFALSTHEFHPALVMEGNIQDAEKNGNLQEGEKAYLYLTLTNTGDCDISGNLFFQVQPP